MIKIYDNNLLIHFAQLSMQYFQMRIIVLKIKLYLNIKPTSKKNRMSKVNKHVKCNTDGTQKIIPQFKGGSMKGTIAEHSE